MKMDKFQKMKIAGVVGLVLGFQGGAQAIPPGQKDADPGTVITRSLRYVLVPNTAVTVNNDVARFCVIRFNAEAVSTAGDEVGIGYVLDSASPSGCTNIGGPNELHAGPLAAANSATWIRAIPGGLHTIRVCYGVADLNGNGRGTAILQARSLTVECRTQ